MKIEGMYACLLTRRLADRGKKECQIYKKAQFHRIDKTTVFKTKKLKKLDIFKRNKFFSDTIAFSAIQF